MSGRIITLYKQTGVRTVGVGGTWRKVMEKCILRVTGQDPKAACGTYQLFGGVEAVIEGGIHAMPLLWSQHSQEEYWGFLLIDA